MNPPVELGPLSEQAVTALLEDAIPWPVLAKDPNIVQRAVNASGEHPLYLKHLVQALLEGRERDDLQNLPMGMTQRYDTIFERISHTPRALHVALIFSASYDMLNREDAFFNYFAMITMIIHSREAFATICRILDRMLDTHSSPQSTAQVPQRLKIFRQAISIFSYIFRRIEDKALAHTAADYLIGILERLLDALCASGEMRSAFSRPTIFHQSDPFNPLLPLGIYCSGKSAIASQAEIFHHTVLKWLRFVGKYDVALYRRIIFELIPIAYFNPEFAIEQVIKIWQDQRLAHERQALVEVLGTINSIAPGSLERTFRMLVQAMDIEVTMNDLYSTTLNVQLPEIELQRLFRAMRVFAWHECITTIMIHHPQVAKIVVQGIRASLEPGMSFTHVMTSIMIHLCQALFSEEFDGDFYKMFGIDRDETQ